MSTAVVEFQCSSRSSLDHLLLHDGPAFWVDANGHATTTTLAQIAPSQRLLNRIHVTRGFTAYQHYSAVCDLPAAANQSIQESTDNTRARGRKPPDSTTAPPRTPRRSSSRRRPSTLSTALTTPFGRHTPRRFRLGHSPACQPTPTATTFLFSSPAASAMCYRANQNGRRSPSGVRANSDGPTDCRRRLRDARLSRR